MRFLIVLLMATPLLTAQTKITEDIWLPTWQELGELAVELDASAYISISAEAGPVYALGAEDLIMLDGRDWGRSGDALTPGVYFNEGSRPVILQFEHTGEEFMLQPQALISMTGTTTTVSTPTKISVVGPVPQSVGCSCQDGYFACCYYDGSNPQCSCTQNNQTPPAQCESGGPGSSSCSLNQSALAIKAGTP